MNRGDGSSQIDVQTMKAFLPRSLRPFGNRSGSSRKSEILSRKIFIAGLTTQPYFAGGSAFFAPAGSFGLDSPLPSPLLPSLPSQCL